MSDTAATRRVQPTDTDHDRESLERRLDAVERALSAEEPLERADRLDELEERIVELEAAVQALRGYVGSVRAVNEEIELRADRALRKAEAVERNAVPTADTPDEDPESPPEDGAETGPTPLDRLRERL